jgi:hypothetical protein
MRVRRGPAIGTPIRTSALQEHRTRCSPGAGGVKKVLEHTQAVPRCPDLPEDVISTTTSLTLPKGVTKDQWVTIGTTVGKSDSSLRWWIADRWVYGDHRHGNRKALAAIDVFGLAFETLMDYGTVARRVKASNRFEALSSRSQH